MKALFLLRIITISFSVYNTVASEETKKILFKSENFYELAELNAAINSSNAEKIMNDAFEAYNEDKAKVNAVVKNRASAAGGLVDVYYVLLLVLAIHNSYKQVRQECSV